MGKKVTTEDFIRKAREVHGDLYDYKFAIYLSANTKVCIVCPIHKKFWQKPFHHIRGSNCQRCAKESADKKQTKNLLELISEFKEAHGDKFGYDKVVYKNKMTKIIISCKKHGDFETHPQTHKEGVFGGCKECSDESQKYNTETFIAKAKEIHGDRYIYKNVEYTDSKTDVNITCRIHKNFFQNPSSHIAGKNCPLCAIDSIAASRRLGNEEFLKRARAIHGDRYGYSLVDYKNGRKKVLIKCYRHGIFPQSPEDHLAGEGCRDCGIETIGRKKAIKYEIFLEKAKKTHGNKYKYSKDGYKTLHSKVRIWCKNHKYFYQNGYDHINGCGCPRCNDQKSKQELKLLNFLDQYIPSLKSDRAILKGKEIDIFIPSLKIGIEYNGLHWHSEVCGKNKKYHLNKTNKCNKAGVKLLHIFEHEFILKEKIVKSRLKSILQLNKFKVPARKCIIKDIDPKTKKSFLSKYCLDGNGRSDINIGLFYRNRLISVMTFTKSKNNYNKLKISKYATINNFTIVGGASKILKYVERKFSPNKIIASVDKRWSNGEFYKKLGFSQTNEAEPEPFYFKGSNYKVYKWDRMKEMGVFESKDNNWETVKKSKWNRIWDCGKMIFEKNF